MYRKKLLSYIQNTISLDYRSLALLRIGLGLTIICDLIQRVSDLYAFYTDAGVLPREVLTSKLLSPWAISFHTASGSSPFELALMLFACVVAIALIIGYRTTLATIISWVMLVSLQNRNPLILQGADVIFRIVLFWSMFLPLGKYMSLDSIIHPTKHATKTIFNIATIAYLVQIILIYSFSGMLKTGAPWHNGTAVYYALNIDQLTAPLGHYLLQFKSLLPGLTFFVLYLERYGGLLMVSPFWNGPLRTLSILLFAIMQIGFNTSMHLGLFGMIAIIATLGLLPSWFWDVPITKLRNWINRHSKKEMTVYYDQNCGFCFHTVFLLKRLLWLPESVLIKKAVDESGISAEMQQKNSWVVVLPSKEQYYEAEALQKVLQASPLFWWTAYIFYIPSVTKIGNMLYKKIAHKRLAICIPEDTEKKEPIGIALVKGGVVLFLCVYVILINRETLPNTSKILPTEMNWISNMTRLDQKWGMFAPFPLIEDGWYVFPARLANGSTIDIFRGGKSVSYAKPDHVADLYKNQRWQKYFMNLWMRDQSDYRLYYGKYVCRQWNKKHTGGMQMQGFKMIFMLEKTLPEGTEPIVPTTIWDHKCF